MGWVREYDKYDNAKDVLVICDDALHKIEIFRRREYCYCVRYILGSEVEVSKMLGKRLLILFVAK